MTPTTDMAWQRPLEAVYVLVQPLWQGQSNDDDREEQHHRPHFLAAQVQTSLMEQTVPMASSHLVWQQQQRNGQLHAYDCGDVQWHVPQQHPLLAPTWPCACTFYVVPSGGRAGQQEQQQPLPSPRSVVVTEATLVHVVNSSSVASPVVPIMPCHDNDDAALLRCFEDETVAKLTLQLQANLGRRIHVGTTRSAVCRHQLQQQRRRACQHLLRMSSPRPPPVSIIPGLLVVHSPQHGAGKTALVAAIARRLSCHVEILSPGLFWAQYGVLTDAAVACRLHELAWRQVVTTRQQQPQRPRLCVMFDQWEGWLPSTLSAGAASPGDAAHVTLQGMLSYLQQLSNAVCHRAELPFPSNNPMYGMRDGEGAVVELELCIVGICTCPDDGWRRARMEQQHGDESVRLGSTILNVVQCDSFRLPTLTGRGRLLAWHRSFKAMGVTVSAEADELLSSIASRAAWCYGKRLATFVDYIREIAEEKPDRIADIDVIVLAASRCSDPYENSSMLENRRPDNMHNEMENAFAGVGGNDVAKQALLDLLALDMHQERLLIKVGLSPPTGMLLYGPPGSGKTLLARAVARELHQKSNKASIGRGTFISVDISDIVLSTVGSSEKRIVAAFENARLNAPAVVFIDEFQAMFTERRSDGSTRLSTTLLSCLDDVSRWRRVDVSAWHNDANTGDRRIVVLAATNTPWMIDKGFLRPGRFDRTIHVGLPNRADRLSIINVHLRSLRLDTKLDVDALCSRLVSKTESFSGADIAALCRAAVVRCLVAEENAVHAQHFEAALQLDVQASSSPALVRRIERWAP